MKKNNLLLLLLLLLTCHGCTNQIVYENRPSDITIAENLTIDFYNFRSKNLNDSIYKNFQLEFDKEGFEEIIYSIDSSLGKITQMNIDGIYTYYVEDQNGAICEYSIKLNNVYQKGTCAEYIEFVSRKNQIFIRNLEVTPNASSD